MTSALLADDEPVLLEELRALLREAWPALQIVACAHSGTQAQRLIAELRPDIVFLDIRMPGIDGLALARLVPAGTQLVFVTAHAEHALEAFEHAAVDYLRKPVTPARLTLTVQRLQARLATTPAVAAAAGPRFLQAWVGQSLRLVELDRIALLLRLSLGELLGQLDPALFWQVHRGAVINARAIERVELRVHLQGAAGAVPVGRSYRARFRGM